MDERSSLGTVSKRGCFFRNARARNTHVEATLNLSCPAQVFTHNFIHADLHPGNVLVDVDDDRVRVGLLDAGLAYEVTNHKSFLNVVYHLMMREGSQAGVRAGQESEIPNFKGSYLGRFPLVSADFWTSDHLSERSRSVDAFPERARAEHSR